MLSAGLRQGLANSCRQANLQLAIFIYPSSTSLSDFDGGILLTWLASVSIGRNETDGDYQIKSDSIAGRDLVSLLQLPQMKFHKPHKSTFPTIFCNSMLDYDLWYESVTYVPPASVSGDRLMGG